MTQKILAYLEGVRSRREASTPGPWNERSVHHVCLMATVPALGVKNAPFIASMPTDSAKMEAALRVAVEALLEYDDDVKNNKLAEIERILNDT